MSDNSERSARVSAIVCAALQHEPAGRLEYARALCADDDRLWQNVVDTITTSEHTVHIWPSERGGQSGFAPTITQPSPNYPAPDFTSSTAPYRPAGVASWRHGDVLGGRYQLVRWIGRGGMGEVYEAADLKLGQRVALKFLDSPHSRNSDRLQRFFSEVRLARQVSHPNVCRVYDVTDIDGAHFISMEYVDGEDLASLLRRVGKVPSDVGLAITRDLCTGLAAAHRVGIVHRDLKPANVLIDAQGTARIADFGLAELRENLDNRDEVAGTPSYMAPEQLIAGQVTERTDIYALGLLMFEMFTGKRRFDARTVADAIACHKNASAAQLMQDIIGIDPAIRPLILACLEEHPDRRPASIETVIGLLRNDDPASQLAISTPAAVAHRHAKISFVVGAVLITLAAARLATNLRSTPRQSASRPVEASFAQLTSLKGVEMFPTLSPDAKWFAYNSATSKNADIYLQSVGTQTAINLTRDSPVDDWSPVFSPDGEFIAFRSERGGGGIFVMTRNGEGVTRLTDTGYNPAWSPDGREIVFADEGVDFNIQLRERTSGLGIVNVATRAIRRVFSGDAVQPQWSPHGRRIAYWAAHGPQHQRDIATIPARGGEPVLVTDDRAVDWNPVWSPDGRYLYFASDRGGSMNLWRVSIDEETGRVLDKPAPITTPSPFVAHMNFSRDGSHLIYASYELQQNIQVFAFKRSSRSIVGTSVDVTSGSKLWYSFDVSPDDKWLALASEQGDLFVGRADGSDLRKLTAGGHITPQWSPDGEWIAFSSNRGGTWDLWAIRPDGSNLTQLTQHAAAFDPIWSPDRTRMAYTEFIDTTRVGVFDPRVAWRGQTTQMVATSLEWSADAWSPDGEWLAGTIYPRRGIRSSTVRDTVGITIFSIRDRTFTSLTDLGSHARWLNDSHDLLFVADGKICVVDRESKSVRALVSEPGGDFTLAIPSHDGGRIYALRVSAEADIWLATSNP